MRFLCGLHRQRMARLGGADIVRQWFEWMSTGGLYYALSDWRQSVPPIGCAFDLAAEALFGRRLPVAEAATKLTLSTIYLADALHQYGDAAKAELARDYGRACLQHALRHGEDPWLRRCAAVTHDPERCADFFRGYLNLPLADGREAAADLSVRACCAR